jgi:hypothetical protein
MGSSGWDFIGTEDKSMTDRSVTASAGGQSQIPKRPRVVRTGGTLLTKAGQVRIGATPQTRRRLVRRPVDPQHARRNPA